jgi:hypothetical protein
VTSSGELGGCEDPDRDGGSMEALPDEEEDLLAGEREHLVPFLSSIVSKWRGERKTLREKWSGSRWVAAQDERNIYSL